MRIAIASDHAGFTQKSVLVEWLKSEGHDVNDLGTHGPESVDYPDYGYRLARAIEQKDAEYGVAICGSGIGISIAVNRNPHCRSALCSEPLSAQLARQHNNANVIALGARLIGDDMAKACVAKFLATDFLGGRHARRVDKLGAPELAKDPA